MKPVSLVITFVSVTTFLAGCKPANEVTRSSSTSQLDNVRREASKAAMDIKEDVDAEKTEDVAAMQKRLEAINTELNQLVEKAERSGDKIKSEAKPKLEELQSRWVKLKKQIDEANNTAELEWGDLKATFEKGYNEFKEELRQAQQWASDKIEL